MVEFWFFPQPTSYHGLIQMYKNISHHTAWICFSYSGRHVGLLFSPFFQSQCGGKAQNLRSPLLEVITSVQSCCFAIGAENVKKKGGRRRGLQQWRDARCRGWPCGLPRGAMCPTEAVSSREMVWALFFPTKCNQKKLEDSYFAKSEVSEVNSWDTLIPSGLFLPPINLISHNSVD